MAKTPKEHAADNALAAILGNPKPTKQPKETKPRTRVQIMARVRADDAAIAGLLALGISQKDIAKLCGVTTQRVAQRKQRVEQYLLTTEERLQGGAKIVDKVIADFVSDAGTVRAADALRLVEMQQARIDPVSGAMPRPMSVTLPTLASTCINTPLSTHLSRS